MSTKPETPAEKKARKAAEKFAEMMGRMGGGSISLNGEELVRFPSTSPTQP